jgi:hypothetical protein
VIIADDLLRRVARTAAVICALAALAALALAGWRAAFGVIGGGVLVAISGGAVAFTVGAFMPSPQRAVEPGKHRRKRALAVAVFLLHYALLALAAYVMIARLRLHPIGLVGGVTSFVLAAALEALRRGRK